MRCRTLAALVAAGCCASCNGVEDVAVLDVPLCRVARPPTQLPVELSETSGVTVSRGQPGVLWTHNDSGTEPVLYALDAGGAILARVRVAANLFDSDGDWEDIAAGACASGECLYIADIGDNSGSRESVAVHRLVESARGSAGPVALETFRVRFPEGSRDAEAMFVLPGERVFIVTKGGDGPIAIYEYPGTLASGQVATLRPVRSLTAGSVELGDRVTGASASPDGNWVAFRTHVSVLLYRTVDLLGDEETVRPHVVTDVRPLGEAQGEGVGLGSGGTIVLTGEGGDSGLPGTMSVLWCDDIGE